MGYRVILFGPPGVGKGTQAVRLAGALLVPHVATGDLFRENVRSDAPLGREAKAIMDRGELVPDDVVIRMVRERLARPDCREGFILDGYPRSLAQADALDKDLARTGATLDAVFYLTAPTETIVKRLAGRRVCPGCGRNYHVRTLPPRKEGVCDDCAGSLVQRDDDAPDTVRKRLTVFSEQTEALVAWYVGAGFLRRVDGSKEPDLLARELVDTLRGRRGPSRP